MIFIRDRPVSDFATVGVDVFVFPRVDARPRKSNVVSDLTVEERVAGVVPDCFDGRDSIFLTTLDEAALGVLRWAAGVDFFEEILVVTVVGVFCGTIVRDARLLLPPTVEDVRARTEAEGVCVLLEATSTVLFTGRDRVALPRLERLEADEDRAGCGDIGAVDLLAREFEDGNDVLVAGADCLF
jgi:hypothetical protein